MKQPIDSAHMQMNQVTLRPLLAGALLCAVDIGCLDDNYKVPLAMLDICGRSYHQSIDVA